MKNKSTFLTLALLLTVGAGFLPTPLMAQTDDPFGEVDKYKYPDNMTIYAQVKMNGEILGDGTVVAVYHGDELRGKDTPFDLGDYTGILIIDVWGSSSTKGDALHFKVYVPSDKSGESVAGRVIEVDQGVKYKNNDEIGEVGNFYIIDLPSPVTTTFSTEGYATTCLPFDAQVPDGVTLWDATGITDNNGSNRELVMEKVQADILPANIPVLLQTTGLAGGQVEWLSKVVDSETLELQSAAFNTQSSILKGTTESTEVVPNNVLTLGHSNETGELGFWLYTGTTIPANRAYIADFPAGSNGARIAIDDHGEETSIYDLPNSKYVSKSVYKVLNSKRADTGAEPTYYDLQGRHTNTGKGVVIIKK